ncbi:hypothetical protein CNMCM5793_008176 [Aspergillus hiratsukae]|uniref:Alpha-1,2-mannosidase n=1 Tax=Aspergillus hiratsukae TaxID=1194566 RepID=A0A8H6Q8M2_9EURO|nr:hypothetical protein CNMCM5793_008176 [Aspergillus hiratsukae]KAF7167824.1 hypothetical protein CNMCM6106_003240 [Aspergillus hiratsukae]
MASANPTPPEIRTAASAVANALGQQTKYALVGGSACVVLGFTRTTQDIDFVVLRGQTPAARRLLRASPDFEVEPRTNHTTVKNFDQTTEVINVGNVTVLKPALILNAKCRSILERSSEDKKATDAQDIIFILGYCVQHPEYLPKAAEVPNATREFVQMFNQKYLQQALWIRAGYNLQTADKLTQFALSTMKMVALKDFAALLPLQWTSLAAGQPSSAENDMLKYVNPLIGSTNGGNVFAGASLPYGMAKAVADVDGQNTGGFATDGSHVIGFSSMHDSGTGGNPSLGNFPLFPQYCPDDVLDNCLFPKTARGVHYVNESVVARPGHFALALENGIQAEMTVSEHAALYRFTFPPSKAQDGSELSPLILVDLTDAWDSRQNASIKVDAENGRITGNGTFLPSFGAGSYVSHFCADFGDAAVKDSGIWVNDRAGTEPQELFVTRGFNLFYLQAGGFMRFRRPQDGTVTVRVGVSFISSEKACQNAEKEVPHPEDEFNRLRQQAESAWREKLSPISVQAGGVTEDFLESFWSGVYRTMLSPQDYTGENPLWHSDEPYYDSFYCIWDSFRAQHPFLTIVDPVAQSRMVRSLLDTYRHEGWLPDCRMSLCKGWTQGGSNADVVLADAFVKNLTGIDWDLAYEAMVNDAENEPLEWSYEGRGGLQSWKRLNYIPYLDFDYLGFGTNSRSISRTLEYSYNDFSLAMVGRGLRKPDYTKHLSRASNWQNLYKPDQQIPSPAVP